ncbi:hypothetical protein G6O67_005478 [Ophiocordyceps sinensis]|uniref:Uncharacterized protein n=1 Tax=Ophiocordyceps sinensis TaxID=72228 RepID=A0A8H4PRT6_9HYPO|nr:hypothetical protein G6O67_005478 [Ophiocordyceps sinensis]
MTPSQITGRGDGKSHQTIHPRTDQGRADQGRVDDMGGTYAFTLPTPLQSANELATRKHKSFMFRLNVPGYLPPPVEILSTKAVPRTSCWTALHSGRRKPIPPYITNYAAKVEDPTWKRVATAAEFLPTLKPTGEGDSSGADGHGSSGADGDPDWTLCLYCSESFEETGDSDGSDIIFMETRILLRIVRGNRRFGWERGYFHGNSD